MLTPFDPQNPSEPFTLASVHMRGHIIACRKRGGDSRPLTYADHHLISTMHVPTDKPIKVTNYSSRPPTHFLLMAVRVQGPEASLAPPKPAPQRSNSAPAASAMPQMDWLRDEVRRQG